MELPDLKKYIAVFVTSSINQVKATEEGDYKVGNKNYDQIVKVAKYLKESGNLLQLINLLTHENIGVKIWAATYLLEADNEKAQKVLSEISKQNLPHHSFTAKMILEEWNNGNLKLQY